MMQFALTIKMRKFILPGRHAATYLLMLVLLSACANLPAEPTLIVIGKDGYTVLGTTVRTSAELIRLLTEQKVTKVDMRAVDTEEYEQIGRAIYAVTRSGIDIIHINGTETKQ